MNTLILKNRIRKFIKRNLFFLIHPFNAIKKFKYKNYTTEDVFNDIFHSNKWDGAESVSGEGSNLKQTATIRKELPILFKKFNIQTLLDLPCGDHYWFNLMDYPLEKYIGADIVQDLIDYNLEKYSHPQKEFLRLDLIQDDLPNVDILFCRDCLVHLSNNSISKLLENVKRSNIKWFLTTSYTNVTFNHDIATGGWRKINLSAPPFSLPPPREQIFENCTEGKHFKDKYLFLWNVKDLF